MAKLSSSTNIEAINWKRVATPTAPAAGYDKLFVDATGIVSTVDSDGTVTALGSVASYTAVQFEHGSAPATPSSGYSKLFVDGSGDLYLLASDGTATEVGAGTGSGVTVVQAALFAQAFG